LIHHRHLEKRVRFSHSFFFSPSSPSFLISALLVGQFVANTTLTQEEPDVNCKTCGVKVQQTRYRTIRQVDPFDLCANCFLEGRFPSDMSSGEFVKLDSSIFRQGKDEPWTEQETVRSPFSFSFSLYFIY